MKLLTGNHEIIMFLKVVLALKELRLWKDGETGYFNSFSYSILNIEAIFLFQTHINYVFPNLLFQLPTLLFNLAIYLTIIL